MKRLLVNMYITLSISTLLLFSWNKTKKYISTPETRLFGLWLSGICHKLLIENAHTHCAHRGKREEGQSTSAVDEEEQQENDLLDEVEDNRSVEEALTFSLKKNKKKPYQMPRER